MKKGLSLPIEMIVIIAIAMLVLVVVAAFFVGGFGGGNAVTIEAAFQSGCNRLRLENCNYDGISSMTIPGYKVFGDSITTGTPQDAVTMQKICDLKKYSSILCARACGCPV